VAQNKRTKKSKKDSADTLSSTGVSKANKLIESLNANITSIDKAHKVLKQNSSPSFQEVKANVKSSLSSYYNIAAKQ
jgi:hypothetical protein